MSSVLHKNFIFLFRTKKLYSSIHIFEGDLFMEKKRYYANVATTIIPNRIKVILIGEEAGY